MEAPSQARWDHSGVLLKRNKVLRNSHRFFGLRGQVLHYYESTTSIHPKHVIDLYNATLRPRPDQITFELSGPNFPKGETLVLQAASQEEAQKWVEALRPALQAAQPSTFTGTVTPASGGLLATVSGKIERALNIDLNGDGHIGSSKTPLILDHDRVKRLNALMRQALLRRGLTVDQLTAILAPVSDHVVELACRKERTTLARRKVMDELVDTVKERMTHKVHKMDVLNTAEASAKRLVFGTAGDVASWGKVELSWGAYPTPDLGQGMMALFRHKSINLDAVSTGCCPIPVLDARVRWERECQGDPVQWRFRSLMLRLQEVTSKLAGFIQADPNDVQFLLSSAHGVSSVFKSQPWQVGDRVVLLSCDGRTTEAAARHVAAQFGLEVVVVQVALPCSEAEILQAVEHTLQELQGLSPKLACVPHVTPDGWPLPAKALTKLFHRHSVAVLVDGSYAVGHIDVNVGNISADYYIGSLHRWLFAPKAVGFLAVAPHKQPGVFPLTVSYFAGQGFEKEFSYTGLQDFSTYTAVTQSLEFTEKVCKGLRGMQSWCCGLAAEMVHCLEALWGTRAVQVVEGKPCYGRMPVVPLPHGLHCPPDVAHRVMVHLAVEHRIQAHCFVGSYGAPTLCVRLAVQVFNTLQDAEALGQAVLRLGGHYAALPPITCPSTLAALEALE